MSSSDHVDKPGRICRLNVGGVRFATAITTLTKYPDSMLGRMFGGHIPTAKDEDGAYFIDRDGTLFRHVLNFLQTDQLIIPEQRVDRQALKVEADYFQISALVQALDRRPDPVFLNIGGHLYSTTSETINKFPGSLLFCMLEGSVPISLDANGAFFVDRDGAVFRHVLNFMRNDRLILPDDFSESELLKEEAEFYQIAPLLKALPEACGNDYVDIMDRSDLDFIMIKAPDFVLNNPKLPFHIHRTEPIRYSNPYSPTPNNEREREELFYYRRSYYRVQVTKTDFCDFLQKIGCRPRQSSMSMTTLDKETVTKTLERWSAFRDF